MNNSEQSNVHNLELRQVQRAIGGDREAQRSLFVMHRDMAYKVAYRVTSNRDDAMDVVQDSFIKAFARLESFRKGASFRTWLLRIVNNTSLDLLRSKRVRSAASLNDDDEGTGLGAVLADSSTPNVDASDGAAVTQRLQDAIANLPPAQQGVFALFACGGLTYGEIAEVVGIPVGTVMSRIHHARKQLHKQLGDLAPQAARNSADSAEDGGKP